MPSSLLVTVATETQTEAVAEYVAAAHEGADVTLLHVVEYTEKKTSPSRGGRDRPDGWYDRAEKDAEALFDLATEHLEDSVATIDTVIEAGDPSTEILSYADEHDVDQLVIGVRKRSPTGKIVFGSTAQDVLLSTTRPVISVPLAEA
ncbi:universal stress protein [Halorarius litoreus]|uniref:universal stress protein n=1 Tax=Halorarius litoreus TaxID=2962676 RepID=UPI0020CF81AC|nr:universal stress protein [Halorarius litoreus]